jgi:hypothetical protein
MAASRGWAARWAKRGSGGAHPEWSLRADSFEELQVTGELLANEFAFDEHDCSGGEAPQCPSQGPEGQCLRPQRSGNQGSKCGKSGTKVPCSGTEGPGEATAGLNATIQCPTCEGVCQWVDQGGWSYFAGINRYLQEWCPAKGEASSQ